MENQSVKYGCNWPEFDSTRMPFEEFSMSPPLEIKPETDPAIANNILIAEFIGFKFYNDDPDVFSNGYWIMNEEDGNKIIEAKDMEFHSSWDWLMSVWEKIVIIQSNKLMIDEMVIGTKSCVIKAIPIPYAAGKSFISFYTTMDYSWTLKQTVHAVIVEFINWYNQNK